MEKIGFIGMGNMGRAILSGVLKEFSKEDIIFSAKSPETKHRIYEQTGIEYADSNAECANKSKYLILAVKPQCYEEVLKEIRYMVTPAHIIISLAPGKTIEQLKLNLGKDKRIVRAMPNTPAMIGEGMTGVSAVREELSDIEKKVLLQIFGSCGRVEFIEENLMDAVVCASGSSPAFVYLFIEALADGEHPGVLKDNVCSPAGTTIEGIAVLEEFGMRNAVLKASEAVYKKCTKM